MTEVKGAAAEKPFPVEIDASARRFADGLRRACCAMSRSQPSAGQIAEYFGLLGQKQISNAVDASNFVLQGMGHPTHAFDLDKIEGGIVVRLARPGEKLKLLDGSELTSCRRRPGHRGPREGAFACGRDGWLGFDDYAADQEHPGGVGVVRSGERAAVCAAAWAAHGCFAPLRAGRGLQRGAASPTTWWLR